MSAHPCPKCGELRKVDIIHASDGWHQPPCYQCGDPGYIEPHEVVVDDSDFQEILEELPQEPKLRGMRESP